MRLSKGLLCSFFVLCTALISAQTKDSVLYSYPPAKIESTFDKVLNNKVYKLFRLPVPLFAVSAITYGQGAKFRTMRNTYTPEFRYHYDDFLQYAPLVAVLGMKLGGVEGRSSWGRMLVSDVFSAVLMTATVNSLKSSVNRMRPDGSANNSFPSGHTATAFMAATIMHREYGLTRSPLYSIGGYTVATATAFSRQLNNKHWLSDVLAGAGIGILSTELGYFIADLIFKDKGLLLKDRTKEEAPKHGRPSFLEFGMGYSLINGSIEIGKNIRMASPGATHVSLKGAYFFMPHFGIGGEISAMASPLAFDMALYTGSNASGTHSINRIYSDPTGIFSFTVGPYFSLPVAGKVLLGTKFQAGYAHFTGNEVNMDLKERNFPVGPVKNVIFMDGKSSNNFLVGTGVSATGIINRNLGLRLYLDYNYTFLHAPYKILTNLEGERPLYSEQRLSKHHLHFFTFGVAVTALFW